MCRLENISKKMTLQDVLVIAQLIASPAALIVTYYVFKLQSATFEAQRAVNDLENKKFLYSIRPQFSIDIRSLQANNRLEVSVVLEKNAALKVDFVWIDHFLGIPKKAEVTQACSVGFKAYIYRDFWPSTSDLHKISLDVFFTDEIGTAYYQNIFGDVRTVAITPPIRVK